MAKSTRFLATEDSESLTVYGSAFYTKPEIIISATKKAGKSLLQVCHLFLAVENKAMFKQRNKWFSKLAETRLQGEDLCSVGTQFLRKCLIQKVRAWQ